MKIRATIIKLLLRFTPGEILRHMAHELIQQASHYQTIGAPLRADYLMREADALIACSEALMRLPFLREGK